MSELRVTVQLDGSAFDDAALECARILCNIARTFDDVGSGIGADDLAHMFRDGVSLRDINGNTVGTYRVHP